MLQVFPNLVTCKYQGAKPLIMHSAMEKVNYATYLAFDFLLHIYNKCNQHVTISNVG